MYIPRLSEEIVCDFLSREEMQAFRKEAFLEEWPCTAKEGEECNCGEEAYKATAHCSALLLLMLVESGHVPLSVFDSFVRKCEEECFRRMNIPEIVGLN